MQQARAAGGIYAAHELHIHQGAKEPDSSSSLAELLPAIALYLRHVATQCNKLPLRGLDAKFANPDLEARLNLESVYIGLETKEMEGGPENLRPGEGMPTEGRKALSAVKAVATHSRLVLLGDPGSGKTTLLNHLSFCLARLLCEPAPALEERLKDWPADKRHLVPLTITLRHFVREVQKVVRDQQPEKAHPLPRPCSDELWKFFRGTLSSATLDDCANALHAALDGGHCIVFFDGLDELPTEPLRDFVRDCVKCFAERYPRARIVLTCRSIPWQKQQWQFPGISTVELAPFDADRICGFIRAWYEAHHAADPTRLPQAEANERRESLQAALLHRPELRRLAGNPMLLTVMALLHTHHGRLPDDRARVYQGVVNLLLLRWDVTRQIAGQTSEGMQELLDEAKSDENSLQRVLCRIAYEAHEEMRPCKGSDDAGATADISLEKLREALRKLHHALSADWAEKVVDTIQMRSGLIQAREENVFTFPHRSLQEFLAAAHLTKQPNWQRRGAALVDDSGYWREVVLWSAGIITHVADLPDSALVLLRELCPGGQPTWPHAWHRIWLAGEALLEIRPAKLLGDDGYEQGPEIVERIRSLLCLIVTDLNAAKSLTPRERALAATALGRIDDPRPGVGLTKERVPDIAWIEIPAGKFLMGSKKGESPFEDETPQFEYKLIDRSYSISRYPVTVAQYKTFVDADGYLDKARDWWTPEGWKWKQTNKVSGPEEYDPGFQTPNHPRVGVSWYEAHAFCRWLSAKTGRDIRLPSEAEWERAARHTDARKYPWGSDEECARRCNMYKTGIGSTSAVGLFPEGNSTCGAADMAGNVWEWCRTKWRSNYLEYQEKVDDSPEGSDARVLRGGSFVNVPDILHCCARVNYPPDYRFNYVGFRVVWVGASAR